MNAVPNSESPRAATAPDSIYTPLDLAAHELRARWNDLSLRRAVEESLNGALPHFFRDAPRALHWPTVASPNIWMHEFHTAAQTMRLAPLVFEYRRDKFHPGNETKRHLLRWRFWQGLDIHGQPRTRCLPTADMNQASGRPFTEVRASNGAKLVDLHASLLRQQFPHAEAHDMSDWIEAWPGMDAFYDAYMSLCICHCVLIESFRTEGSDRILTERVFIPAFEQAMRKFGVKPLIVALEPVDGPIDLYWYSYPAEVEPLARQALNGGSGKD